ncbi:UDP-glucose 4-epimerase [Crateriforma conspicua]|uniref:UDP-glucose 4-epimerase n=1 Tax=Crateriforma conspicua TaxID=2527996 RepID=A0A5C6FV91_9PLAN|nr:MULTISPECIES: NAD-dependent epimerase/dehydratase family protein [Crateriforma]TWU67012.1 UDP-glucose 4-epimerase [Crateriforma conspicua]
MNESSQPADADFSALCDWRDLHADAFDGTRCLITGGAGFIGSHLAHALVTLGAEVVLLDDLSGGSRDNVPPGCRLVEGCIRDHDAVALAMDRAELVFHLAALGSVPRSITMPAVYTDINIGGTMRVLEVARQSGVRRLVLASSSSVYGETPELPKHESMPMLALSPYAASKIACEALVRSYAKCYDIDTACLRFFNVFGPRQNANSAYAAVIAAFGKALADGKSPIVYDDGEQSRDFTFVENVVHANLLAARSSQPIDGAAVNVACGRRVTVNELAKRMMQSFGHGDLSIDYRPARTGDIRHSLASLDRASELLGYEPVVDFEAGLDATVRWMRSEG